MGRLRQMLNSKPFLWALLALPALLVLRAYVVGGESFEHLLHPTGEWSARLMIVALMLTPLAGLFRGRGWIKWLIRRRRAFGVAAFGYAALHLLFYLADREAFARVLAELGRLGIWTGWAAFLCFLPLAITSNDASVRWLKANWKRLHRLAYPAAVLTLLHWTFIHGEPGDAIVNFLPLAALEAWRFTRYVRGRGIPRHA